MISNGARKALNFSIFFLLVLIIAWLTNQQYHWVSPQTPVTPKTAYTVDFFFSPEDKISLDYSDGPTDTPSLLAITQAMAAQAKWDFTFQDYGPMGILITQIRGEKNGTEQKYWQYFINDQQPLLSVDKYYPNKADKIEWKFISSAF
jgi:hypothetical protein